MKCPHCKTGISENFLISRIVDYPRQELLEGKVLPAVRWLAMHQRCPECHEFIIKLHKQPEAPGVSYIPELFVGYPHFADTLRDIPAEVVSPFRDDFREACAVLTLSPKASAALSRRCLQAILREKAKATKKDLADQIDEVVNAGGIPSYIAEQLHAVRNIGNFAAHPIKSTSTSIIVDVEPGEAEWNLDVIESLFDFYFVQPAITAKRKTELNLKLKAAGKPELK